MKFCSFSRSGQFSFGVALSNHQIVDLVAASNLLARSESSSGIGGSLLTAPDLKSWLAHGPPALQAARQILEAAPDAAVFPVEEIRLQAPIPRPGKIVAIGLNYRDHAEEQKVPLPERPLIFAKFPTSVIGPGEEIRLPAISQKVDPEAELCAVLIQPARHFTQEQAHDALAFMVGNDVSARDLQFSDQQWVRGKSCDTFSPCGPWLVTNDEVGDPHALNIELRLNGNVQQKSSTRNLIFNCYQLVEFISQAITLEVGDIIFTGTPAGVGVFRDPPVFLKPGDLVEVEIEKLGVLKNPVA